MTSSAGELTGNNHLHAARVGGDPHEYAACARTMAPFVAATTPDGGAVDYLCMRLFANVLQPSDSLVAPERTLPRAAPAEAAAYDVGALTPLLASFVGAEVKHVAALTGTRIVWPPQPANVADAAAPTPRYNGIVVDATGAVRWVRANADGKLKPLPKKAESAVFAWALAPDATALRAAIVAAENRVSFDVAVPGDGTPLHLTFSALPCVPDAVFKRVAAKHAKETTAVAAPTAAAMEGKAVTASDLRATPAKPSAKTKAAARKRAGDERNPDEVVAEVRSSSSSSAAAAAASPSKSPAAASKTFQSKLAPTSSPVLAAPSSVASETPAAKKPSSSAPKPSKPPTAGRGRKRAAPDDSATQPAKRSSGGDAPFAADDVVSRDTLRTAFAFFRSTPSIANGVDAMLTKFTTFRPVAEPADAFERTLRARVLFAAALITRHFADEFKALADTCVDACVDEGAHFDPASPVTRQSLAQFIFSVRGHAPLADEADERLASFTTFDALTGDRETKDERDKTTRYRAMFAFALINRYFAELIEPAAAADVDADLDEDFGF